MWKRNQLEDPIPESSSSREAGGINIPPLHFDSSRQGKGAQKSIQSSDSTIIPLDKLRLFYLEKIHHIKQGIDEQIRDENNRRVMIMREVLNKSNYSREEVKDIMTRKDIQMDEMLSEFFQDKIGQQQSQLNLLQTFNPQLSVVDLIRIINDLVLKLSQKSNKDSKQLQSKQRTVTLNPSVDSRGEYSHHSSQFKNTIDTIKNQNNIVADKLRAIINRRRSQSKGIYPKEGKQNQNKVNQQINQRLPTFTNLNINTQDNDGMLSKILTEVKGLKSGISNINGKLQNDHLTDKTLLVFQKEYQKATEKIQILENQIQIMNRQLIQLRKSRNSTGNQQELVRAMEKIIRLQEHIDAVTDNFNRETQQLQQKLDAKDRKIRQLAQALNTFELINMQKETEQAQFQDTVSNSVDNLMLQIDRLNKQLKKAELEIDGHQLTIMRLNKMVQKRDKTEDVNDNELVRQIQRQCDEMATQNWRTIQDLDKQTQIKEKTIKSIFNFAAQKSSRTNQSRQKGRQYQGQVEDREVEYDDDGDRIDALNTKIQNKIQQIKLIKEKNMLLEQQNTDLGEEIMFLRNNIDQLEDKLKRAETYAHNQDRKMEEFSRNKQSEQGYYKSVNKVNTLAKVIDSYSYKQKTQMIDCFTLVLKILSESVSDISVITRCQNLLRCAESQRDQQSNFTPVSGSQQRFKLQKLPIFDNNITKIRRVEQERVDSIPTLEMPYKKSEGQNSKDKNSKIKRKPIN